MAAPDMNKSPDRETNSSDHSCFLTSHQSISQEEMTLILHRQYGQGQSVTYLHTTEKGKTPLLWTVTDMSSALNVYSPEQ
jgi:hypothetical protein